MAQSFPFPNHYIQKKEKSQSPTAFTCSSRFLIWGCNFVECDRRTGRAESWRSLGVLYIWFFRKNTRQGTRQVIVKDRNATWLPGLLTLAWKKCVCWMKVTYRRIHTSPLGALKSGKVIAVRFFSPGIQNEVVMTCSGRHLIWGSVVGVVEEY